MRGPSACSPTCQDTVTAKKLGSILTPPRLFADSFALPGSRKDLLLECLKERIFFLSKHEIAHFMGFIWPLPLTKCCDIARRFNSLSFSMNPDAPEPPWTNGYFISVRHKQNRFIYEHGSGEDRCVFVRLPSSHSSKTIHLTFLTLGHHAQKQRDFRTHTYL